MDKKTKAAHVAGRYKLIAVITSAIIAPLIFWYLNKGIDQGTTSPNASSQTSSQVKAVASSSSDKAVKDNEKPESEETAVSSPSALTNRAQAFILSGEVIDPDGSPVIGAKVQYDGKETHSNNNGQFELKLSEDTQKKIIVSKSGFDTYSD